MAAFSAPTGAEPSVLGTFGTRFRPHMLFHLSTACLFVLMTSLLVDGDVIEVVDDVSDEEHCEIVISSRSAKHKMDQVDQQVSDEARASLAEGWRIPWYLTDEHQDKHRQVHSEVNRTFPNQLCDEKVYSPSILKLNEAIVCEQICRRCFPGSVAICFLRNYKYENIGETCLCTYSLTDPLRNAAFSLRHEKRVFSRRWARPPYLVL
ncbi:unnamed protein product [Caenorhabditis auriculariae]|uniref:Uncharacterized protein n=1 Tax=Caenorhabditis auriculariae TaxID=2777116 RepID=A0A8S1HQT9_9PELO|nr:unnamed protein product [Caenorhabditis auriculariae]